LAEAQKHDIQHLCINRKTEKCSYFNKRKLKCTHRICDVVN
jgi:hypothetical protein